MTARRRCLWAGRASNWCSTCYCVSDPAGVANPTVKCRTDCAPDEAKLRCCDPDTKGDSPACCGLTGAWVTAPATEGGDVTCKHVSRPVADPMGAPFAEACAKPCTVDGVAVSVGWVGKQSGASWCNKCRCAADGLKCRDRTCRPARCCPLSERDDGYGAWKCCGATGKWVMGFDGVFTCARHTKTTELPFGEACGTCDIPGVEDPVQVGWFGKIQCNNCYCKTSPPDADLPEEGVRLRLQGLWSRRVRQEASLRPCWVRRVLPGGRRGHVHDADVRQRGRGDGGDRRCHRGRMSALQVRHAWRGRLRYDARDCGDRLQGNLHGHGNPRHVLGADVRCVHHRSPWSRDHACGVGRVSACPRCDVRLQPPWPWPGWQRKHPWHHGAARVCGVLRPWSLGPCRPGPSWRSLHSWALRHLRVLHVHCGGAAAGAC